MFRAIVFDLDDTLYAERDYVLSGFRAVAEWASPRLDIPAGTGFDDLEALFLSGVRGDTFARWLAQRGLGDDSLEPQMVEVYRSHRPRIAPRPEVPALLNRLKARYRLGLITDGPVAVQRSKLEALGLAGYFDVTVYSDGLGGTATRKPHPLPYQTALAGLAVHAYEAVYVADNPTKDFLGARAAGMLSVRLRTIEGIYASLEAAGPKHAPDAEIDSLMRLEKVLWKLEPAPETNEWTKEVSF